jgi:Ca2+-binding EF-hand superfamily protein
MRIAHSYGKQSPELITKGQFKLVMTDVFKVRDNRLLDNIYLIADIDGSGALDIRELCAGLIMHMRGAIEHKLALLFEVMKNRTVPELSEGGFIIKQNLIKIIQDASKFFKQAFLSAKQIADQMNANLDGKISYDEFYEYCRKHPPAMDFICRLTIN